MLKKETVVIFDTKGKDGQLIARKVRDRNVYCEVRGYSKGYDGACGVILAGDGSAEVKNVPVLDLRGKQVEGSELDKFLFDTCKCKGDFTTEAFIEESVAYYKERIGDKKALCALSGGVDSSVCAALIYKAIGKNLRCIFVDTGLMRKNEGAEVKEVFTKVFGVDLIYVDAEARFLEKLAGVQDPERKRKIIGEEFIRVFEEEAKKIGGTDYLVQGTIYPDVLESGLDGAASVKSHHNVGGLPDHIDFKELVEPLRFLFKDEVRKVGVALGLPDNIAYRQPFPGPGLGVRALGALTKERLDTLRDVDYIYRDEIDKAGLGKEISQYFAVLLNEKSVGLNAKTERVYGGTVALRAIKTTDFMTVKCVDVPFDLLQKIALRITAEVKGINRVVFDVTPKPPATVEWE